ncbi:MAG: YlbF family regulator [Clostridia bacterium]|nr:YlbF family regulator [Clostridia bacterium]
MDIIELTRKLGAAIQEEEAYKAFHKAKEANEQDDELNELINKIQLIHMSYQHEAAKDDANEGKLQAYDKEFSEVYKQVMANTNMQNFEKAKDDLDVLMKRITGILSLCAQGEDPETCDYSAGCSGDCSSCGGCSSK